MNGHVFSWAVCASGPTPVHAQPASCASQTHGRSAQRSSWPASALCSPSPQWAHDAGSWAIARSRSRSRHGSPTGGSATRHTGSAGSSRSSHAPQIRWPLAQRCTAPDAGPCRRGTRSLGAATRCRAPPLGAARARGRLIGHGADEQQGQSGRSRSASRELAAELNRWPPAGRSARPGRRLHAHAIFTRSAQYEAVHAGPPPDRPTRAPRRGQGGRLAQRAPPARWRRAQRADEQPLGGRLVGRVGAAAAGAEEHAGRPARPGAQPQRQQALSPR